MDQIDPLITDQLRQGAGITQNGERGFLTKRQFDMAGADREKAWHEGSARTRHNGTTTSGNNGLCHFHSPLLDPPRAEGRENLKDMGTKA